MSILSLTTGPEEDLARSLLCHRPGPGPQPGCTGYYHEHVGDGKNGSDLVDWGVKVALAGDVIKREVCRDGTPWNQLCNNQSCNASTEDEDQVIWPTWPARPHDDAAASPSPLADVQEYWRTVGNRLRDSAKWMAAVLGAALATLIGSSPLAAIREQKPQPIAIFLGGTGLVFLSITMFLVVQVMRPQAVSFADVQQAKKAKRWLWGRALRKWQNIVEEQQDLYLPCGVKCLTGLRQSMIVEEITLVALSRAIATAYDQPSRKKLCQARAARAARLRDLRATAAMVATVGEYYTLRYRSSWATYGGILCGLSATAAIVLAFAWPLH